MGSTVPIKPEPNFNDDVAIPRKNAFIKRLMEKGPRSVPKEGTDEYGYDDPWNINDVKLHDAVQQYDAEAAEEEAQKWASDNLMHGIVATGGAGAVAGATIPYAVKSLMNAGGPKAAYRALMSKIRPVNMDEWMLKTAVDKAPLAPAVRADTALIRRAGTGTAKMERVPGLGDSEITGNNISTGIQVGGPGKVPGRLSLDDAGTGVVDVGKDLTKVGNPLDRSPVHTSLTRMDEMPTKAMLQTFKKKVRP